MLINPAIKDRSTGELLEIIESPEDWQHEVVALAQSELRQRGVSGQTQELRRKSQSNFQRKIAAIKARASYTTADKVLIILFGPILIIVLRDLLLFHAGEGYKKKNRQGLLFLLLGFVFWIVALAIIFN